MIPGVIGISFQPENLFRQSGGLLVADIGIDPGQIFLLFYPEKIVDVIAAPPAGRIQPFADLALQVVGHMVNGENFNLQGLFFETARAVSEGHFRGNGAQQTNQQKKTFHPAIPPVIWEMVVCSCFRPSLSGCLLV